MRGYTYGDCARIKKKASLAWTPPRSSYTAIAGSPRAQSTWAWRRCMSVAGILILQSPAFHVQAGGLDRARVAWQSCDLCGAPCSRCCAHRAGREGARRGVTLSHVAAGVPAFGAPAGVYPAIAFLASDEARWITGDTVRVDGGSKL